MKRTTLLAAVTLSLFAGAAMAQKEAPGTTPPPAKAKPSVTLKVGDAAPPLTVTDWVKGDAITGFEKGRVYVVDFWATWCGPCVAAMPHLTHLQKEYKEKGFVVLGVSGKDPRNTLEAVQKMVKDKGEVIGYSIAFDGNRETNNAYMEAGGEKYIPCAFVIDGAGKIAFKGNESELLDVVLEDIAAGTWNTAKDAAAVQTLRTSVFGAESPADRLKGIQAFEASNARLAKAMLGVKFQAQAETGDYSGAALTAKDAVAYSSKSKNAEGLNTIAWTMVDPEGNFKNPDLDLALKAATEANKITGDKDGAILDTLARVYWLKGDKAKAIETQTKAVANAKGPMKEDLEKTLNEYKGTK